MKLETKFLKPSLWTFVKFLILGLIPFWSFGTIIYIFTAPDPFDVKMYTWWSYLILIPIGSAIGFTLGTSRIQITIANPSDLENVKKWSSDFLTRNRLIVKLQNRDKTVFRSKKFYNQMFGDWFGTELISIKTNKDMIIISGPLSLLDKVDTELRFGKVNN
jgi:hypothetical protein